MNDDFQQDESVDLEAEEALLRERGYDPQELSEEDKRDILADVADSDADNDRLGNVGPADQRDGSGSA